MVKSIARGGLADYVYDTVKSEIFELKYGKDGRLHVEVIAKRLEVSRQPVMDALKRLEIEGFVEIVPQVGCKVRNYSPDEINDFYKLFAYAESLIAEIAASRLNLEDSINLNIISSQISRLTQDSSKNNEEKSLAYRILNRKLHKEIRRIARSSALTELVEKMGDRSDFFVSLYGNKIFSENILNAHNEHLEILGAILKNDAENASKSMRNHILKTNERLNYLMSKNS